MGKLSGLLRTYDDAESGPSNLGGLKRNDLSPSKCTYDTYIRTYEEDTYMDARHPWNFMSRFRPIPEL